MLRLRLLMMERATSRCYKTLLLSKTADNGFQEYSQDAPTCTPQINHQADKNSVTARRLASDVTEHCIRRYTTLYSLAQKLLNYVNSSVAALRCGKAVQMHCQFVAMHCQLHCLNFRIRKQNLCQYNSTTLCQVRFNGIF